MSDLQQVASVTGLRYKLFTVQLSTHMRKRFAALAVVGLVGWLLVFASHLHLPDERASDQAPQPHPCLFCAAFQPGAGPVAVAPVITLTKPEWLALCDPSPVVPNFPFAAYRSRAPPSA